MLKLFNLSVTPRVILLIWSWPCGIFAVLVLCLSYNVIYKGTLACLFFSGERAGLSGICDFSVVLCDLYNNFGVLGYLG